jgi:glyoxylase-like metal-dependent hydrolase (beta-lactamase superfamily II)
MKISDTVELIDKTMANVYVIKLEEGIVQIDSGMKNNAKKIIEYYKNRKIKPDFILITHDHLDHIGALKRVYDEFKPKVYAAKIEVPIIQGHQPFDPSASLGTRILMKLFRLNPEYLENVNDIEQMNIKELKVIPTPGHTAGSISILYEREKILFVGDAVVNQKGVLTINEKYSSNMEEAKKSKEIIESYAPITILSGHGASLKI